MLPRSNAAALWLDGDDDDAISWPSQRTAEATTADASLSSFKSMLDSSNNNTDCFINNAPNPFFHPEFTSLLFNPIDSPFNLDSSHHIPPFLPPKSMLPSLFTNNFDNGFDLSCDQSFFQAPEAASAPILTGFNGFNPQFQSGADIQANSRMLPFSDDNAFNFEGFDAGGGGGLYPNRSKLLRPLEVMPTVGAPPTLFQKRAALRQSSRLQNLGAVSSKSDEGLTSVDDTGELDVRRKRKRSFEDEMDDIGGADVSAMNYDSDEPAEKFGDNSNANSGVTVGGDQKGKKKGMPAKNLMAERRRRKKLNDRLYMLRSVVPKISKVCVSAFQIQ